jgi:hypothetical protein
MEKNTTKQEAKVAFSRKKIGREVPIEVNEITDAYLYSGSFGTLDSARMQSITDRILDLASTTGIEMIIIDLANVDIIDSAVVAHLVRLGGHTHPGGRQSRLLWNYAAYCPDYDYLRY